MLSLSDRRPLAGSKRYLCDSATKLEDSKGLLMLSRKERDKLLDETDQRYNYVKSALKA